MSGVDLLNATVNASGGRFVVLRGYRNPAVDDPLSEALARLPESLASTVQRAISQVDASMPAASRAVQHFVAADLFESFEFEVRLLSADYIGIRFAFAEMNFTPTWANPIWEWIGSDVTSQPEMLTDKVRTSIEGAIDMQWIREPLVPADIPPQVKPPFWFRWLRFFRDSVQFLQIASGSGL